MAEIPQDVLNEPAFQNVTPNSLKIDDSDIPELTPSDSEPEVKVETRKDEDPDVTPRFQDRFNEVYGESKRNERLAQEAQDRADRMERMLEETLKATRPSETRSVPDDWKKALGDTPVTQEFYDLLDRELTTREQRATEKAYERLQTEQAQQNDSVQQGIQVIDSDLDELEKGIGRALTDDEQDSILDIADEMTPKDRYGNYAQPLIPLRAAYGEYRARQLEAKTPQKEARARANAIVSARGSTVEENPAASLVRGRPNPDGWRKALGL